MALQGIRKISPGIVQDPAINSGRPIIEGTRVFVDRLIGHLETGMSTAEICQEYDLTPEQVLAVKRLSVEQVQYVKGYADALENVALETLVDRRHFGLNAEQWESFLAALDAPPHSVPRLERLMKEPSIFENTTSSQDSPFHTITD
jgi:uncharacterized protein (DUF433 family)